jgi:HD-like signal output (HDOD) protein
MSQADAEFIAQLHHDADANALQIPSLPEVVIRVRAAIDDPSVGVVQVAKLIQMDPALAARLLKIANSPLYHQNLELRDLKQAIQRLGLGVTRNIVTSLVMHNVFNIRSDRLHLKIRELWQHSCRVAAISQVLAGITPGLHPDRAMLAGLLHDIGVLPVLVYADKFPGIEASMPRLVEIIAQMRAGLGEKVMQQWQLGDDLNVVPAAAEDWQRDHAGPADYGDLVQVAQLHSYYGMNDMRTLPPLAQVPAFNKLSLAKMGPHAGLEILEQARSEINATIRMLNG